ncbi:MAG TPA: T9SS type A sorting domain-containing protein [Chitinophagales bacterium]|nr:T9SS type A sorting domain-containing protein [Chitinophagales bacterium]
MLFRFTFITVLLCWFLTVTNAQVYPVPEITWEKCFGGSGNDSYFDTEKTPDGGYISVGESTSTDYDLAGVCCPGVTKSLWLCKLDSNYNIQWQKLLQAIPTDVRIDCRIFANKDQTYTLFETIDGDGVVPLCTCNHSASQDIWMFTVDNFGNIISQKCFGGSAYDLMNNVSRCEDRGYIIGASSGSGNGDVGIHYGSPFTTDAFIVKTDSLGNIQWTKTLGGTGWEGAFVSGISDNRCLINIGASSNDYDLTGKMPLGETMVNWLMITDSAGNILQDTVVRAYDGKLDLNFPYEYKKNNYLIVGYISMDTGMYAMAYGGGDALIAVFDSSLALEKVVQFGGTKLDNIYKMNKLNDSTIYFTGRTYSSDYDAQECRGLWDAFIVKTDTSLNKLWSRSIGGSSADVFSNLFQSDSTIVLFGSSAINSADDGDILNAHYDEEIGLSSDSWVIFLNENVPYDTVYLIPEIKIYPNPSSNQVNIVISADVDMDYNLAIYSLDGKMALSESLSSNIVNEVKVNSLPSGYYIFSIRDGSKNEIVSKKILIL